MSETYAELLATLPEGVQAAVARFSEAGEEPVVAVQLNHAQAPESALVATNAALLYFGSMPGREEKLRHVAVVPYRSVARVSTARAIVSVETLVASQGSTEEINIRLSHLNDEQIADFTLDLAARAC